jgi:uncharacterized protein YndB with AHSA1/START domain
MENGLFYRHEVKIEAPAEVVWDAFVDPENSSEFLFGCQLLSDWELGSSVKWEGNEDGAIYAQGIVVTFDEYKELAFTVYDPDSKYNDAPENHLVARFTFEYADGITTLKIKQGDYSKVENGEQRHRDSSGWVTVFEDLKQMIEELEQE